MYVLFREVARIVVVVMVLAVGFLRHHLLGLNFDPKR